ncbi:hypothetical protein Efla_002834 [Eimeria flavescens]
MQPHTPLYRFHIPENLLKRQISPPLVLSLTSVGAAGPRDSAVSPQNQLLQQQPLTARLGPPSRCLCMQLGPRPCGSPATAGPDSGASPQSLSCRSSRCRLAAAAAAAAAAAIGAAAA